MLDFYIGMHQPCDAWRFPKTFISVKRLLTRKSDFEVNDWIMDSGAYTEVLKHGRFLLSVEEYAAQIKRWSRCGNLLAAVAQDYVCDTDVLQVTGMSVKQHQELTTKRYLKLLAQNTGVYIIPVLQGSKPEQYVEHLRSYGKRIGVGAYVGVGSLVSKSTRPQLVEAILTAILRERPDLKLHGFGVKLASLTNPTVLASLTSADSQAWSRQAWIEKRPRHNHWTHAMEYLSRVRLQCNKTAQQSCYKIAKQKNTFAEKR